MGDASPPSDGHSICSFHFSGYGGAGQVYGLVSEIWLLCTDLAAKAIKVVKFTFFIALMSSLRFGALA